MRSSNRFEIGGVFGALVVLVVGGFRGMYVWRWQYEELREQARRQYEEQKEETLRAIAERDQWVEIVKDSMSLAERTIRKS